MEGIGRPSVMTPDVETSIIERIADGESVAQIARDENMPASSTIYLALANDEAFSERYARACEARTERFADEILEIADDASNDYIERKNNSGDTVEVVNHDHIARSRLRVDSRKWLMSKMAPKKYGDKVTQEITGKDGGPLITEIRSVTVKLVRPGEVVE